MITDEQFEEIAKKIMALPNMKKEFDSDFMAEPNEEGVDTYIKFMSDHGITDDHNGNVFYDYLIGNGAVVVRSRPRSMVVLDADLVRLFLS